MSTAPTTIPAFTVTRDRQGALQAETRVPLGTVADRRELRVSTYKGTRGLVCRASVVQHSEDGLSFTHAFGLGAPGSGDFSRRLAEDRTARATERAIRAMHEAHTADLGSLLAEALAHYAPAPTVQQT